MGAEGASALIRLPVGTQAALIWRLCVGTETIYKDSTPKAVSSAALQPISKPTKGRQPIEAQQKNKIEFNSGKKRFCQCLLSTQHRAAQGLSRRRHRRLGPCTSLSFPAVLDRTAPPPRPCCAVPSHPTGQCTGPLHMARTRQHCRSYSPLLVLLPRLHLRVLPIRPNPVAQPCHD